MAMSGVKPTEACMTVYQDIQKSKKHRYVIFMIRDEKQIDVEKIGERSSGYNDYLTDLKQKDGGSDDCRYGLFDYDYKYSPDGAESINRSKIFLMSWCPDTSKIKKKMLYSASFETLQKAFVGVHKVIQANDESDLEQTTVEEALRANDRN
jgi:cofilin